MRRFVALGSLLLSATVVPGWADVTPLLGCTVTTTGTSCHRGSATVATTLPRIGDGVAVNAVVGTSAIGYVRNSGTFSATLECQLRVGDPFFAIAGSTCTDSCVIPVLPTCNDVRVNVTACAACNVSVYVLKEQ